MQLRHRILTVMVMVMAQFVSPVLRADTFTLRLGFDGYSRGPGYYHECWRGYYWHAYGPSCYASLFYGYHYPIYYIYYPAYYYPAYYYSIFYYPPVFPFYYTYYYPWLYYPGYSYPRYSYFHYGYHHHHENSSYPYHHRDRREQHHGKLWDSGWTEAAEHDSQQGSSNRTPLITIRKNPPSGRDTGNIAMMPYTRDKAAGITAGDRKAKIIYRKQVPPAMAAAAMPGTVRIVSGNKKAAPPRATIHDSAAVMPGRSNNATISYNQPRASGYGQYSYRQRPAPRPSAGTNAENRRVPAGPAYGRLVSVPQRQAPVMRQNYRAPRMEKQYQSPAHGQSNDRQQAKGTRRSRYSRP